MRKKHFIKKIVSLASVIALSSSIWAYADDTALDNDTPSVNQTTEIGVEVVSEATVTIPKKINIKINDTTGTNVIFNTDTGCYEYLVEVSASGNITPSESVFANLDTSTVLFTNIDNPNVYFEGNLFYLTTDDKNHYDFSEIETSWSKEILENKDSAVRTKTMKLVIESESANIGGKYTATVDFAISKGTENSAMSSWATAYKYVTVGNGDVVITGFSDELTSEELAEMKTVVIPKKIKKSNGTLATVVGIERGAFYGNTTMETLKVLADCSLGIQATLKGVSTAGSSYTPTSNPNYALCTGPAFNRKTINLVHTRADYSNYYSETAHTYKEPYSYVTNEDGSSSYTWRISTLYFPNLETNYASKDVNYGNKDVYGAFQNCTALKNVYLIGNVEIIGFRCFKDCTNLGNINIPASCKYIAWESFINAPNVKASFLGKETKLLYKKPGDNIYDTTYNVSTGKYTGSAFNAKSLYEYVGSFTPQPFAAYDITCSGTPDAELLVTEFFPKTTDITAQSLNGTVFDVGTTRIYK